MQVGISDEERAALIDLLRERVEGDRSPQLRPLKTFLTKIDPVKRPRTRDASAVDTLQSV